MASLRSKRFLSRIPVNIPLLAAPFDVLDNKKMIVDYHTRVNEHKN
jgi:hypothetical protein